MQDIDEGEGRCPVWIQGPRSMAWDHRYLVPLGPIQRERQRESMGLRAGNLNSDALSDAKWLSECWEGGQGEWSGQRRLLSVSAVSAYCYCVSTTTTKCFRDVSRWPVAGQLMDLKYAHKRKQAAVTCCFIWCNKVWRQQGSHHCNLLSLSHYSSIKKGERSTKTLRSGYWQQQVNNTHRSWKSKNGNVSVIK